jgi:hypothetical protein
MESINYIHKDESEFIILVLDKLQINYTLEPSKIESIIGFRIKNYSASVHALVESIFERIINNYQRK